jgi:hypothetical protein
VKPERREFETVSDLSVDADVVSVSDALHASLDAGTPLSPALLAALDDTHRRLLPRLRAEDQRISAAAK